MAKPPAFSAPPFLERLWMDKLRLLEIILFNRKKDFINRMMNANDFPVLENRDGTVSTHSMAYGEADGQYFVYPTVVYQDGKMMRLGPDTAWTRAMESGDYVMFENEDDAREFSSEYKQFMPFFESSKDKFPKRKTIWKDLNTGPGDLSGDSISGVSDGN